VQSSKVVRYVGLSALLLLCFAGVARSVYYGISQHPGPGWAVRVFAKKGKGWSRCTGELIAPRWVLTAAHCVFGFSPSEMHVRVRGGRPIAVVKDVHAPGYTIPDRVAYPDLGLIELSVDAVARYGAETLPLAPATVVSSFAGRSVTFFGFGYTQTGRFPKDLQKTQDGYWSLADRCPEVPGDLCFVRRSGAKSEIAKGDSGGAWVGWRNGGWRLLAIESGTKSCGGSATHPTCPTQEGTSPSSELPWIAFLLADGKISYAGKIGSLTIDGSTGPDITQALGRPDYTATGSFDNAPGTTYRMFGYGCRGSRCTTNYYINLATDRLESFDTTSPVFSLPRGIRVGMSAKTAARRENRPITCGREGITVSKPKLLIFIGTQGGRRLGNGTVDGGHVSDIDIDDRKYGIGATHC
jgi:Trypsin